VSLTWAAPASIGGSSITGYQVYRGTASGGETLYASLGVVTSYTDTGTQKGVQYYYEVAAVNAQGTGSMSNQASSVSR
jgi:fibronectin type 3 domain-containing protein